MLKDLTASEFNQLMSERPEVLLLDVRTPQETLHQSLPNDLAINIMDEDFVDRLGKLDKEKPYLVYCRSGNRSGQACRLMEELGFTEVYNLSGGLMNWPY